MTDRTTAARPAGTDRPAGVAADLERARVELDALRSLRALGGAEGREHDAARVYDASIRWGTFVAGRLQRLALLHDRHALGAADREQYERLTTELHELAPLLDRLGLPRPCRAPTHHD